MKLRQTRVKSKISNPFGAQNTESGIRKKHAQTTKLLEHTGHQVQQ